MVFFFIVSPATIPTNTFNNTFVVLTIIARLIVSIFFPFHVITYDSNYHLLQSSRQRMLQALLQFLYKSSCLTPPLFSFVVLIILQNELNVNDFNCIYYVFLWRQCGQSIICSLRSFVKTLT